MGWRNLQTDPPAGNSPELEKQKAQAEALRRRKRPPKAVPETEEAK